MKVSARNKKRVDMTQMPPMQTYTKGHNSEVPHAIFLAIKLDHEFIPKHNYRKFGEDWMKSVSYTADKAETGKVDILKGHNSEVCYAISAVIELDLDFIPKSMYRKFGKDWMQTVTVRERKQPKRANLIN